MKILLPVDGSAYTQRMLDYVVSNEEFFGKQHTYVALTAVSALSARVTSHLDRETVETYYRDQSEPILKPVVAFAAERGWKLETLAPIGRAGDEIARAAESGNFDLIVLGSHGHSSLGALVLGSVTSQVLALCKVPTLIVR